jgi:hypothetical protein
MLTSPTRPWKHSLTTIPTKTENSLISLYDLFYNSSKILWIDSTAETEALKGCKLEHDIICLNTNMLKTDGTVDSTQAADITASTWWSNGIDISLPMFDARAKKKEIECNASVNNSAIFYENKYVIYDKDSALEPKDTNVFTSRGIKIKNIQNGTSLTWENYSPPSIGIYNSIEKSTTLDILLSAQDKAFKSTLVTQDGFDAYNRLFINPYTNFAVDLVIKATGMNLNSLIPDIKGGTFLSPHSYVFSKLSLFWDVTNSNSIASEINKTGNDAWFNLLKNTFVWVRAPFYADYIKPDDFEQSLTPESKVVHNELMLSGAGDFKKYDMSITQDATLFGKDIDDNKNVSQYGLGAKSTTANIDALGLSELSMPYIPKTSPTVDIYTSKLLDEEKLLQGIKGTNEHKDPTNYSSKISLLKGSTQIQKFLDEKVSGNDMIIRGLPVAAINRDNAVKPENTSPESLIPPNWFDPENRYSDEYYSKMTKFPTVVPKDGNLYVDGRIIGPTIDEIWIMLKKLTGGRLSDDHSDTRATELDIGIPVGTSNHSNNTDTTMTEVPDSEFNFKIDDGTPKYGDPIDFKYDVNVDDTDKSNLYHQKLEITKFVNQNDTITYPVYSSLKLLSGSIVKNTGDGNCCIKKDGEGEITTNRGITSFTAWKDISKDSGDVIEDNASVNDEDTFWGPRKSAPYSLRELEAMIKGNKYNIITQARFVKENFAVTGGLGKRTNPEGEKYNFASGSIYQMHQNYNFDVAKPNTFYNNDGTDTGFDSDSKTCGARAVIDDPDMRTFEQRRDGHIRYVEEYGKSDTLSLNPEKFSSQDVYLSAAGDWRYVSDHVRIPILRGEWI